MKHAKNESESSRMLPKNVTSPSTDEGSSGGSLPGGGGLGSGLKKGPWTSAEDAILVEYVQKHGEGNWNAVQKHSGLSRCGKSCRLRWANHLRPNLKKGAFTAEEERTIIELHSKMGNKWARMAASLPGRTDNEIKNYWNTRIKRRQRAGLPIYPPTMSFESTENQQQDQTIGDFATDDKMQIDGGLLRNGYGIPSIQFDNYNVTSAEPLTYAATLPTYSFTNMLCQGGFESSHTHGFVLNPAPLDSKRLRVSDTLLPAYPGDEHSVFDNSVPYDPDPISMNIASFDSGSHSLINGNFSTPRTLAGTVKSELPSLQYTTNETTGPSCYWAYAYPSSPPLEAIETYIQSPPTVSVQSECSSPRNSNSGLLEEVLHESHALLSGKSKHLLSDKSTNSNSSSAMTPSDMMDNSSANNFCDVDRAWEDYDPISPLGGSASSIFNEYTPPASGGSPDELPPPSRVPSGSNIKLPNMAEDGQIKPRPECLRPDALLGCPSWLLESNSQMAKEHSDMNNAIATLLAGDYKEQKPVLSPGTGTTSTSSKLGQDSCQWNNMPSVCQIPDLR